ncbi:hypothetical protein PM082_014750 [Marasmius tenuissimus]|nr:hypothetical protein PM082_014750 [Marasmius tenuissimus]
MASSAFVDHGSAFHRYTPFHPSEHVYRPSPSRSLSDDLNSLASYYPRSGHSPNTYQSSLPLPQQNSTSQLSLSYADIYPPTPPMLSTPKDMPSTESRSQRPSLPSRSYTYPGQVPQEIIYTEDAATRLSDRVRRRCFNCSSTDTRTWRRSSLSPGKVLCNKCGLFERTHSRHRPADQKPTRRGVSAKSSSSSRSTSPQSVSSSSSTPSPTTTTAPLAPEPRRHSPLSSFLDQNHNTVSPVTELHSSFPTQLPPILPFASYTYEGIHEAPDAYHHHQRLPRIHGHTWGADLYPFNVNST